MADTIRSFKDLRTWQASYDLALIVYSTTKTFPDYENFALSSQLRRAVVSISSNIAEGFSRSGLKEKIQFYHIAKGSLTEVESQLLIANGLGYVSKPQYDELMDKIGSTARLLSALIKSAFKK